MRLFSLWWWYVTIQYVYNTTLIIWQIWYNRLRIQNLVQHVNLSKTMCHGHTVTSLLSPYDLVCGLLKMYNRKQKSNVWHAGILLIIKHLIYPIGELVLDKQLFWGRILWVTFWSLKHPWEPSFPPPTTAVNRDCLQALGIFFNPHSLCSFMQCIQSWKDWHCVC